jgi:uncharacterized membrane protein (UPF0182 family)
VTFPRPERRPFGAGSGRPRPPIPRPEFPKWGRPVIIGIVILILLVIVVGIFVSIDTEHLWFDSVGYSKVFTTRLVTRISLFFGFGLFAAALCFGNVYLAYRLRPAFRASSLEQLVLDRYRTVVEPRRKWLFAAIAVVFGLIFGSAASGRWQTWLLWSNATSFGHKDPQFHKDVSYFAFIYPFQRFVLGYIMALVVICTLLTFAAHYVFGGIAFRTPGERVTRSARTHLALLLFVFVICKAIAYYLDRFGLAFSSRGFVNGASFTDVHAVLPAKAILAIIALICAALFIASIFRPGWLLPGVSFGLLVFSAVIIGGIYPTIVQYAQVRPSEQDKEAPYISRNIAETRFAYDLNNFKYTQYDPTTSASQDALTNSTAVGAGVRLLDNSVLAPTYNQLQQFRNFYNVSKLDVDRYVIKGQEQDAIVAMRELNLTSLPPGQKSWINQHLVYTHGYGFVAAPGSAADSDGRPAFVEQNIPPSGGLGTYQPRVYFGEGEKQFSIVGAEPGVTPREYDFPTNGDVGQQSTTYTGGGGIAIGSTFRQLEYALRFGDKNLLLSDGINSKSRILYDRDPRTRIAKVAPYLTVDGDPYAAIVDNKLVWIIDGYTTSDGFPYAERENLGSITKDATTSATTAAQGSKQINYVRNSVKATVDAYTGTVTLYAWDEKDPVLATWMKVFPGTVKPKSAMDAQLLAHVRYPEDMFKVQRNLLAKYHVSDPVVFYRGDEFWQVPGDPIATAAPPTTDTAATPAATPAPASAPDQPPYYLTLTMPGQSKPTFSLTSTLVFRKRSNLAAFMAVDSDPGPDYGTIRVLQVSGSALVNGPGQVQNQFESDATVQQQLALLRNKGGAATVDYGNLLTLPVAGGLLYVEPVYVAASGGEAYPLLQKVLVSFGNRIGFENTYAGAINALVHSNPTAPATGGTSSNGPPASGSPSPSPSGSAPSTSPTPSTSSVPPSATLTQAIADAQRAYDAGQTALKSGDFAAYGVAQQQLAAALARAAAAASGSPPTPSASSSGAPGSGAATPSPTPSASG